MSSREKIALVIGVLALSSSLPGIPVCGEQVEIIWRKPIEERFDFEKEGFPPGIKAELTRKDVPKEDKEWLMNSVRITVASHEKVLITDDGKVIQLPKDIKKVTTSRNLKYMLFHIREENPEVKERYDWYKSLPALEQIEVSKQKPEFLRKPRYFFEFLYMDNTGRNLWTRKDMPGRAYISDDGKTVVAIHDGEFFSSASFYDEHGDLIRKAKFAYGRSWCADLSASGEFFSVISGLNTEFENSTVITFDSKGNELWTKELKGKPSWGMLLAISDNGDRIAVCLSAASARTHVLDREGNVVYTADFLSYIRSFSGDGNYLALLEKNYVDFIDVMKKKRLWRFYGESKENYYKWLDVSALGEIIAIIKFLPIKEEKEREREKERDIVLTLLKKTGEPIWQGKVGKIGFHTPRVSLSPNGKYIRIVTDEGVYFVMLTLN